MTKKISFRKAQNTDAPIIRGFWANPKIMAPIGFPLGLKKTTKQVEEAIAGYDHPDAAFLLILDEENEPIGEFCFERLNERVFQFDIKIGNVDKQGYGYGFAAVEKGIALIFKNFTCQQIQLDVNATNNVALNLYEKVGFQIVQKHVNSWVDQQNKRRDSIELTLTKKAWQTNKNCLVE